MEKFKDVYGVLALGGLDQAKTNWILKNFSNPFKVSDDDTKKWSNNYEYLPGETDPYDFISRVFWETIFFEKFAKRIKL